jgi:hypothetical protein
MTTSESKPMRKWAVVAALMLLATAAIHSPAEARDNVAACNQSRATCDNNCHKWSDGQFRRSCKSRCQVSYKACLRGVGVVLRKPGGGVLSR